MFRIECFCDDKRLPLLLKALAGLTLGNPGVVPVANAQHKNGKLREVSKGGAIGLFADYVKQHKLDVVRAMHVKEFLTGIGRTPTSHGHILKQAMSAGLLRKHGKGSGMVYKVAK